MLGVVLYHKVYFYNHPSDIFLNHSAFIMLFLLTSVLLLVIGLPLALFAAGYGQAYLDYGPAISGVLLVLLLMLDFLKLRRRR